MTAGIGIGAAIAISAGASAAASIYGANKQAGAAKDAAAQQQAAAQAAIQSQGPLYDQARQVAQQQAAQGQARLDPWAQQGGAGLTALSSFLGVPQPSASANAARSASLSPYAALPPGAVSAPTPVYPQPIGTQPMDVFGPTGRIGPGTPNGLPLQTPAQAAAQRAAMNAPMVAVRSPSGQVGMVPRASLQQAIKAGGTPVGAY